MSPGSNPKLVQKLRQMISVSPDQVISFADFMAIALYEPELGYYASSHRQLGPMGDFVTSSHLTHDYGELIGVQLLELWEVLDRPDEFTVVEVGAGQGLISADALSYLMQTGGDCLPALRWKIVETSEALIRWQRHYLGKRLADAPEGLIEWTTLEALKSSPIRGCIFSNELLDAFPFHWLQFQNGQFHEVCIAWDAKQTTFVETLRALSPPLTSYVADMVMNSEGDVCPEGYRCEVNLALKDWVADVAQTIRQGYVLTIDYGYPASQLYSPARRDGTIQCYTQQKSHDNPLINIGNQDITSHVNFTALERYGLEHQLEPLGLTQQGVFLMALGLGDRLMANNANTSMSQINDTLQRRDALHALMNPMGLGGFKVMLQGKGLTPAQQRYAYRGLRTFGSEILL